MKKCTTCKQTKSKLDFNKNKSKKDGLNNVCRKCSNLSSKRYYSENLEKHKLNTAKHRKKHYHRNRRFIADYLLKHPCVDCGETNPIVLEFDHIEDKYMEVSKLVRCSYSVSKIKKEIEKCEVRCANCHRLKTARQFNWWIVNYIKPAIVQK